MIDLPLLHWFWGDGEFEGGRLHRHFVVVYALNHSEEIMIVLDKENG